MAINDKDSIASDSKKTLSANIRYYMYKNDKTRKDVCDALGFTYSAFSQWLTGKKYPRIDKIERMAEYFGVSKADLIERRSREPPPAVSDNSKINLDVGRIIAAVAQAGQLSSPPVPPAPQLSQRELDLLSMFRQLDERGKSHIEQITKNELALMKKGG